MANHLTQNQERKKNKKLRFQEGNAKKPSVKPRQGGHAAGYAGSGEVPRLSRQNNEDQNTGVASAEFLEQSAEGTAAAAEHLSYSSKMKKHRKAVKLEKKMDAANVEAMFRQYAAEHPEAVSNPVSRWRQKQEIKRQYAAMKAARGGAGSGSAASGTASGTKKAGETAKTVLDKLSAFAVEHSDVILLIIVAAVFLIIISSMMSSCSVMINGANNVVLGTSFTAEEEDLLGADADYSALETALRGEIDSIESDHPDYDEYRYSLAEIGHNPYELAALLTVLYEDYTRAEVQAELQRIFAEQYELTLEEDVEIRTRTETHYSSSTDPVTGETTSEEYEVEVEYEYYILNVTLTNTGVDVVARNSGLDNDQLERYDVLLETRGNRDDLFGDVSFAVPGGEYTDYDIPGEALTDERFRRMITEAEKYLGMPYVWGGSSPATSFDCSGFVSYVINHCGNGWNVGRQTANGLKNQCAIIPGSEAKPGDLIFFQGTYNTSGASHVGIYVGANKMIHCGNPISYASIDTPYWTQHFYCFGRLP